MDKSNKLKNILIYIKIIDRYSDHTTVQLEALDTIQVALGQNGLQYNN